MVNTNSSKPVNRDRSLRHGLSCVFGPVWPVGAGCYSQAALPMPLSKPLYIDHYLIHTHTPKPYTNPNFVPTIQGKTLKPHLLRALYMLKRRGQGPVPTSNCDWYMVDLAFEMTESLDDIPQTQLWLRWFLFLCLSHSAHMLHKPMRHCTLTANPSHYPFAHCSPCHKTTVNLMD